MRKKTDAVDYKYFTEPNLVPIDLETTFIQSAIASSLPLSSSKRQRYQQSFGLSTYDANQLTQDVSISEYFDALTLFGQHYKLYANWLLSDIASYLNKTVSVITVFPIEAKRFAILIDMIAKSEISNKQAKELFELMLVDQGDPRMIADKKKMLQISDEGYITQEVEAVLLANPQSIVDYQQGKDRAIGFLIGQIMKKTGGKVNPTLTNEILLRLLKSKG
jgi:aspartyl-tRNA(Asn)/glutamyl-tRNA(Gln) amidotransferase subunit B